METTNLFLIDGEMMPIPDEEIQVRYEDIDAAAAGRDESGVMHIDWLRRDVRKVNLHYNAITESELAYMMGLMQGKEFTFKFLDQGSVQTINAYASESSYEFYSYSSAYDEAVYVDFEIHVIEK